VPPTLGPALRLGIVALARERWLLALGLAAGGLRRLLSVPAVAFAWAIALEAAVLAGRGRPSSPLASLAGAAAAVTSSRFLGIAAGLWLAGALCGAALRVAYVSGAAPALAAAMGGGRWGADGFAASVAAGFPRVAATAALGFIAELSGGLFALALALGALRLLGAGHAPGGAPGLALATALALTLAVAVPWALGAAADAAVARAAVAGDGPADAFAAAARRVLARPGSFLLGALLFGVAGAIGTAAVELLGEALAQALHGAGPAVLVGPGLLASVAALAVAALVDLAWLGTVSALACAETR
jgi:hypothetical protein